VRRLLAALAIAAAVATACTPASETARAPVADVDPVAAVHVRKCSACHTLPQPGTRTRAYLEQALARHRKRVRLADDQWHAMVDYLALRE
jgi:hypothetical protein